MTAAATIDWRERALAALDSDGLVALVAALVRFPSITPPGGEGPIAAYLLERFRASGLEAELTDVVPGRPNVTGRLGPAGGRPHLILNGHTDVVPPGEGWSNPPFEPVVRDGRLYGRGSADMKGGLAALICAVEAVARAGVPLAGTVTIAAVADEEGYQTGTQRFVETCGSANFGIVAEPTGLAPVVAQKGDCYLEITTRGLAAHASTPYLGRNAIQDMAAIVAELAATDRGYAAGPAHPLVGPPTLSVGTISGGINTPIVPESCRITVDRRVPPGQSDTDALADVRAAVSRAAASRPGLEAATRVLAYFPPSEISADEPVVRTVQDAVERVRGVRPAPAGLAGTTDANIMIAAGIPTVILGPGSLAVCHKPDEWLSLDELLDAARVYVLAILEMVGVRYASSIKHSPRT